MKKLLISQIEIIPVKAGSPVIVFHGNNFGVHCIGEQASVSISTKAYTLCAQHSIKEGDVIAYWEKHQIATLWSYGEGQSDGVAEYFNKVKTIVEFAETEGIPIVKGG